MGWKLIEINYLSEREYFKFKIFIKEKKKSLLLIVWGSYFYLDIMVCFRGCSDSNIYKR